MSWYGYIREAVGANGTSIVLTTRGPNNKYLEVQVQKQYNPASRSNAAPSHAPCSSSPRC